MIDEVKLRQVVLHFTDSTVTVERENGKWKLTEMHNRPVEEDRSKKEI